MLSKTEFRKLFDTYFDTIRRFVFYRCGNAEIASDIAQDVFVKVWEKREQLSDDNLKSLLYKMAGDAVVSHYRKENCRADFVQSMTMANGTALQPDEELAFRQLASAYNNALLRMPEKQRVVFMLSRNDELKYSEIAARLDISIKAVEKRMSIALQYLRNELL